MASIEYVGIDDFAIKKRHKYATIMVNQTNHRIISAINSREITDIQKWLQQYPNLKVVSRDGSNILKLIKRIMHGRCDFDLLKTKTLRLEFLHTFN